MADHPLVPAITLATTQINRIKLSITELNALGGDQDGGAALRSGSAADRRRIARELRKRLSRIARVGKQLDQELYPGTAEQFRCTTRTYAELMNRGNAFVDAVGPVKAAFVEHGLPADFDEQLANLLVEFGTAGVHTDAGLHQQMDGTAGMEESARKGVKAVRILDAIMREKLKDDPAELSVWIKTQQIKQGPSNEEEQQAAPAVATVTSVAGKTSIAASNGSELEQQPAGVESRVKGSNGGVLVA
jgi:hypothetical protein